MPIRALVTYYAVSNVDKALRDGETPVRLCNYSDVYNNEFISPQMDHMQATASDNEIERFSLSKNDVIITKDSESWEDIGVPALVIESSPDLVCGYHLALLRPNSKMILGAFLLRCLQARPVQVQLELAASGITRYGVPKSAIGATLVPVPPIGEQRAIVDYLDRETARLDALVAEHRRLLDLLDEKRVTLITSAVIRGLDRTVPFRDSGVPWIGEIPAHWELWKLGHVALIGNGSTPNRGRREYWEDGDVPWLNSSVVNRGEVTGAEQFVTRLAVRECHLPIVKRGAVLVAITGQGKTRGRAAVLSMDATVNQHIAFISSGGSRLSPWYLKWTLSAAYDYLRSISDDVGGTKGALTCEELANLRVPVPPAAEQRKIVEEIAARTQAIDELAAAAERTAALLRERRSALIAAAVTGRIDLG